MEEVDVPIKKSDLKCIKPLTGHNDWIRYIIIHDKMLFTGSGDTVKIWNINTLNALKRKEALPSDNKLDYHTQ